MANNPRAFDARLREARQRAYLAAPTIAELFPTIDEVTVDLQFVLAGGKPHSSPYSRLFVPDMQAYFELHCPDRECTGGGFDLEPGIRATVNGRGSEKSGSLSCQGHKGREPCGISLNYRVTAK